LRLYLRRAFLFARDVKGAPGARRCARSTPSDVSSVLP
jgi:hypothetical protein